MLKWISDRSLSRYFKEMMRYQLLSREEEAALARRARLGDVIVAVDGRRCSSPLSLKRHLKPALPGSKVSLKVRRGTKELELDLEIPILEPQSKKGQDDAFMLGMRVKMVSELVPEQQETLGTRQGLLVTEVEPNSPAAHADLRDYNRDARDKLILHNLRWVVTIAKQYQNRGFSLSELINEGNLGLIQAVSKFDETRQTRLTTYSNWWIRYYIVTALASRQLIKLPIKMRNLAKRIRDSYGVLTQRLGRTPSLEELAEELGASPEEVSCAFDCNVAELSIDALPFEDSKISFEEVLKDTTTPSPIELTVKDQIEREIRSSINELLSPRERYVISRHFGIPLPPFERSSRSIYDILAEIFGRSKEEMKRLICSAGRRVLANLRRTLGEEGLKRFARISEADIKALPESLKQEESEEAEKCLARVMRKVVKNTPASLADQLEDLGLAESEVFALFWKLTPPHEELNLRELGDLLGVSREAARQVKERSIKKLKRSLRPQAFDDFFREAV